MLVLIIFYNCTIYVHNEPTILKTIIKEIYAMVIKVKITIFERNIRYGPLVENSNQYSHMNIDSKHERTGCGNMLCALL